LKETLSHWVISGDQVDLGTGALVGVLNISPDSFSDGGSFVETETAIAHGVGMVGSGAALVDVGGESTRPGARPVAEDEELRRIMPTVAGLVAEGISVSVDTYKPDVARRVLAEGAVVINDVTGFRNDEMVEVAASSDCGLVVVHMQGTPADMHIDPVYSDVVAEVEDQLLASVHRLEAAGVSADRIVLDPGIGFGKRASHSLQLLADLGRLAGHGFPIMVGTSRKGFLGDLVGSDSRDRRDLATAVTTAIAFSRGARLFRVHDVSRSRDALSVAAAIVTNQ
jgi:dihydropteroate synthase